MQAQLSLYYERGLPVFGPLDHPEPICALDRDGLEVYAWLWVDAEHLNAQFRGDGGSHEVRMESRPYQGPDV